MKLLDVLTAPWAIEPAKLLAKRSLAKAAAETHYYTGKKCAQGHVAPRRVLNGGCQECLYARSKAWTKANPEKAKKASAAWQLANRKAILENRKAYRNSAEGKVVLAKQRAALYAENPKKFQAVGRDYYSKNIEKCNARNSRYIKSIPGYDRARGAERRASLATATPLWSNRKELLEIYKSCPQGMQVDHIVPLLGVMPCGSRVSGLHVPNNLRHLGSSANSARKNRMTAAEVMFVESHV